MLVPYNFAPEGWLPCDGRLIPVQQNAALFSLLSNTYGGDGRTTFGLPDLRSRVPVGVGQGTGLTQIELGDSQGQENVTLSVNQMPAHIHNVSLSLGATAQAGTNQSPSGLAPAMTSDSAGANVLAYGTPDGKTTMAGQATAVCGPAGGSLPVNIRPPYLGLQYVIATTGNYPPRP